VPLHGFIHASHFTGCLHVTLSLTVTYLLQRRLYTPVCTLRNVLLLTGTVKEENGRRLSDCLLNI